MQKILLWMALFLYTTTMSSCSYDEGYQEVTVKEKYQIQFPNFMEATDKLSSSARVQYVNFFRNIYAIVIDQNKTHHTANLQQQYLKSYTELVQQLERPQKLDSMGLTINGLPAIQVQLTGDLGGDELRERIYYQLTFIESPTHIYKIVLWTWDSWRDKYSTQMDSIVSSFKEIKKDKAKAIIYYIYPLKSLI